MGCYVYQILLTKIPENVQQLEGETTSQILLVTGLMKGKKRDPTRA